jgi:hypothetical protein
VRVLDLVAADEILLLPFQSNSSGKVGKNTFKQALRLRLACLFDHQDP